MFKKIILAFGLIIVLVLAAAIALPFLYKDKIVQMVKDEANNNLNAVVNFGDFDISILSTFPNFQLSLNDLSIAGVKEFKGDTLSSMKNLAVTLDIMSVINGDKVEIISIHLENPRIHALVLSNGKANWDIAKEDTSKKAAPSEPSKFNVSLREFSIKNGEVLYEDNTMALWTKVSGLNHELKGDFTQDLFTLVTKTTIEELSLSMDGMKYLSKAKTALDAELEMDMVNSKYTFKENELKINELGLGFDGWLAMPKSDIDMDLKFNVKQSEFKNFISMVPGVYTADFNEAKATGKLAFDGYVKGTYNDKKMPGFALNLSIENGSLKYPALPSALNNVQVNLKVTNPDGKPDNTVINLSRMHIELGKEPFDMKLLVKTPISDANIDASVKGKIDLGNMSQIIPLEKGTKLTGLVNANLTAAGRMSSIEKQQYENFKADGQLSITNLEYSSPDLPQATKVSTLSMTFNPRNVTLNNLQASIGTSDMKMSGTLDNFIAYALKDETLKGTLNFTSNRLDVDQLMSDDSAAPAATDTAAMTVFEVPLNIDFAMKAAIGTMIFDKVKYTNISGGLSIRNQTITMSDLGMNMLDGRLLMNGSYETKNPRKPGMDFVMAVTDFDIQETQKTFPSILTMAPIASKCYGKYSVNFTMKGQLDEKMDPIYNTLNGGGKLRTKNMVVNNFEPLVKVADALKMKEYAKMDMNNIDVSFKFANGRVNVEPFDTKIGKSKTSIFGNSGFDQTIDYTMNFEIPRSEFGGAANSAINGLIAEANKKGTNLSAGEFVNVNVKIGGTMTNPVIKTGLKESASNAVGDLKDKAKDELDKAKREAEERAKAELDKAKREAEDRARGEVDKAKQKAQAEADRVKKEAEDRAKAEAEKVKKEAADKAKKEAEKGVKNLFNKK